MEFLSFLYNPWVVAILFVVGLVAGTVWGLKSKKAEPAQTAPRSMQANAAVLAVVLAVLFSLPTLSIDIEGIFTYAFDIVNAFMPLIAIVAGLGLGFNLVSKIGGLFKNAL